jgi:hypothetical protein
MIIIDSLLHQSFQRSSGKDDMSKLLGALRNLLFMAYLPSLRFLSVFLLMMPLAAHAQTPAWSGIISPSRAVNWANAGVLGGIPNRTTVCVTFWNGSGAPSGSLGSNGDYYYETDGTIYKKASGSWSTDGNALYLDMQTAIQGCTANEVVYVTAGSYTLTHCVAWNDVQNVTLRGAGADQTKFFMSGNDTCPEGLGAMFDLGTGVASYPGDTYHTDYANWTAGYSQGTTSLTLSTTSGLAVGDTMIIDQCDDGFIGGGSGNSTCTTGSATDTGNVWTCEVQNVCSVSPGSGGGRTNRAQQQMVLVTACSPSCPNSGSTTVTISPGLYMPNWRSGQNPMAFWPASGTPAVGDSVENLSIDMTGESGQSQSAGIMLFNAFGSWVTGVRFVNTVRNSVWLYQASRCTIANNYMYGTQNAVSQSYGVEHYIGSDNLIENNIGQHITTPMLANGADVGDVWAFNFDTDNYYIGSVGWQMAGEQQHAAGTGMDLYEGNEGSGFLSDVIHGTHNLTTLFRNLWSGWQPSCDGQACSNQVTSTQSEYVGRYFNYIGNVLGTSGVQNTYVNSPSSRSQAGKQGALAVYELGWCGQNGIDQGVCTAGNDLYTATALYRWGNYDVENAAVQWNSSEVPSGLTDGFANPVPSTHTLPSSFFLSTAPSFWTTPWGTPPWPAIGPDVVGGNVPNLGGFANHVPADLCYANSPVDTSYQKSFPVTAATWSSGTVTITALMGSIAQGEITVSDVTPAAFNGTFQVTASTPTSISYSLASSPGAYATGGSVFYPNVRLFNESNCYGQGVSQQQPTPPTGVKAVLQ